MANSFSLFTTNILYLIHSIHSTLFQGTLKLSIFVVQEAAAPKNEVEFRQRPIGDIRRSLATLYDVWRRRSKIKTH